MKKCKVTVVSSLFAWSFPALLPVVHIAALKYFWSKYHFPVDTATCNCECWDSVFKGPYENGNASYKNFYFNATLDTLKIWLLISSGAIFLYETSKYMMCLLLRGKLRFSMFALFTSSIFPHYYSWWVYINYWNDGFYDQWNHQFFFTTAEIISTYLILSMANIHKELTRGKLLTILTISAVHLILGGLDQFIENIFLMRGAAHQVIRDLGLMIPDVLHIVISIIELGDLYAYDNTDAISSSSWIFKNKQFLCELLVTAAFITMGCLLGSNL